MKSKVHHFPRGMPKDQNLLKNYLNRLRGDVIAIIPNVAPVLFTWHAKVDFVLVVEKLV